MSAERIIGVDFGTSTSVIRVKRYENGEPIGEILETKEVVFGGNSDMVPTLVMKKNEDESVTYYGYEVQKRKKCFTNFHSFKVDLESSDPEKRVRARKLTEEFFRFMAKQYAAQSEGGHLGSSDDKERTIISYPVKWSDETKQFMIETAKKAGFPNVSGMDEAQAAIHAVMVQSIDFLKRDGLLANGVPANVLLMDMGAGTTDLVLCRYTPGSAEASKILNTWPKSGDILFGGKEIDSLLQNFFRDKMDEEDVRDVLSRVGTDKFKSWKEETVSPALRNNDSVSDFEVLDNCIETMEIDMEEYLLDRAGFENCLKDYLKQLPVLINGCIEHSGIRGENIDLVIVTGGHSQWYFVKEMLAGKMPQFGQVDLAKIKEEPARIISVARPQETVALGLAYQDITVDMLDKAKQEEEERKRREEEERKRRVEEQHKVEAEYTPESDDEISGRLYLSNDGFYIDRTGKTVFHNPWPCPWDRLGNFSEGLACVERVGKSGYYKYGYIDKTGKLVIPYQWNWAGSFSEGLACVERVGKSGYYKYGYIDKTGKLVIPYQWSSAGGFSEGLAYVSKDGRWGYIDKTGKLVIPCQWDGAEHFWQGLARVKKNGKYGYIDKTGKLVIPCQWDVGRSYFSEGFVVIRKDDKYGYIDKTGKLVSACQWEDADAFGEGLAKVKKDDRWGYIDKTGKLVIPCQWDDADAFSEGLASVKKNGKYGFIDKTGKLMILCQWDWAGSFSEGLAWVEKPVDEKPVLSLNNKGYIDKTGKLVIPYQWSSAKQFKKGVAQVDKYEGLFGFTTNHYMIDKNGRIISKIRF